MAVLSAKPASPGVSFSGEGKNDDFGWIEAVCLVCLSLGNTEDVIILTNDHRSGINVSIRREDHRLVRGFLF
jgi:hypothetical protein